MKIKQLTVTTYNGIKVFLAELEEDESIEVIYEYMHKTASDGSKLSVLNIKNIAKNMFSVLIKEKENE